MPNYSSLGYSQVLDPMTNAVSTKVIIRDADGATIPTNPENVDYQAFMAWLAEGNEPNPPSLEPMEKRS